MYSATTCFGELNSKEEMQKVGNVPSMNDLGDVPEGQLQPLHSVDRVGTSFCRYNDELVERIEFEVSSRDRV
jgi:hypothetical protein